MDVQNNEVDGGWRSVIVVACSVGIGDKVVTLRRTRPYLYPPTMGHARGHRRYVRDWTVRHSTTPTPVGSQAEQQPSRRTEG